MLSGPGGYQKGKRVKLNLKIFSSVVVCLCTVSVMQVYVHIEDSLVLLPQFEDSQHGIVHITET